MKKLILAVIIFFTAFPGCARKELTEKEFNIIWQEFLRREFEESFDEKQSISQKEKILTQILSGYEITLQDFLLYMKKNHNDKYKKIFIE